MSYFPRFDPHGESEIEGVPPAKPANPAKKLATLATLAAPTLETHFLPGSVVWVPDAAWRTRTLGRLMFFAGNVIAFRRTDK